MTVDDYLALLTSAHSDKPKFVASVGASVAPLARVQEMLKSLTTEFDLDYAVGKQLDVIGEWVGRPRRIKTPLVGIYFAWDDTDTTGFDSGVWQGPYDPTSGLVDLPDDAYRTLLRAKIAANNWDGTIDQAYDIWTTTFGSETFLIIQDNQDMSMVVGIAGQPLSVVEKALLTNGYIPLKPEGVKVNYYAVAPGAGPLFGFDIDQPAVAGWDTGQWATELIPA